METCDWNPTLNEPANCPPHDRETDCKNDAVWALGSMGHWHLCASCAALPAFNRFKRRYNMKTHATVLIKRRKGDE